jgi:hypothetical protein
MSVVESFEADGGWSVGAEGDQAVSGRWERVVPRGTAAAPYLDTTPMPGQASFVTQNGSIGGSLGEADVDGGRTTLLSPVYSFFPGGAFARLEARYRRWYSNHVGARPDDAWRVDASDDGGATWINLETSTLGENRWVPVAVDLRPLFGDPHQMQFRFVAEDSGTPSLVEAGLDDFEILAIPQNPVAVILPTAMPARALGPATPNPSSEVVRLRLTLPIDRPVVATVRDLQGRVVKTLAGDSWIEWNGRSSSGAEAAAGVYWIEARVDGQVLRRKLVRVRAR